MAVHENQCETVQCPLEADYQRNHDLIRQCVKTFSDTQTLYEEVKTLCAFGERLSNANEAQALAWLEGAFRAIPGVVVTRRPLAGLVSIPKCATLEVNGKAIEALTHPMTPCADRLSGELVWVTPGENSSSVAGKIALVRGLATEKVVSQLECQLAKGAVFITGPLIHNMIVSKRWGSPTRANLHQGVGIPVVSINEADGLQLVKSFEAGETLNAVLSTEVENRWGPIANLEATLPANVETKGDNVSDAHPEDLILMTGHLDSWGPGALDNASGLITMLNVVRFLSHSDVKRRRALRVVIWSGHSHGRYAGSAAYADTQFDVLSRHGVLNINVDCLGGEKATLLSLSPAMACTSRLAQYALETALGYTGWKGSWFTRSCDQSFWGMGLPSLFSQVSELPPAQGVAAQAFGALFGSKESGGYGDYWHTIEDTPEHLSEEHLVRDASVILAATLAALTFNVAPIDAKAESEEALRALENRISQIRTKKCSLQSALNSEEERTAFDLMVDDALDALTSIKIRLEGILSSHFGALNTDRRLIRALVRLNYAESRYWTRPDTVPAEAIPCLEGLMACEPQTSDETMAWATELRREVNALFVMLEGIPIRR